MILKYPLLAQHLKKNCAPVYLITGEETFLCQQASMIIKQAWQEKVQHDTETTLIVVQNAEDWAESFVEANTYALFTRHRLLDIRFEKKTLERDSKQWIEAYASEPNPRCLVLIQAPALSAKALNPLPQHPKLVHIPITPLRAQGLRQFIINDLNQHHLRYEPDVPELIFQYNQNHVLACHQIIEQLSLVHSSPEPLTAQTVKAYLQDQGQFVLYDLGDAILAGQGRQAHYILGRLLQAQTEPILILWCITQELRKLIQLQHLTQQSTPFAAACQQLNIWSQKVTLYQQAYQRLTLDKLYSMLRHCQHIDTQLKTTQQKSTWNDIECLVLELSK